MLERDFAETGTGRSAINPELIQFYSIGLMPTADGRVAVSMMATLCEHEGELEGMDLGSYRVDSIDDALATIRDAIASIH
jgi:hypothetical protein